MVNVLHELAGRPRTPLLVSPPRNIWPRRIKASIFVVVLKARQVWENVLVFLGWRLCGVRGVAEKCVAEDWRRGFPEELPEGGLMGGTSVAREALE